MNGNGLSIDATVLVSWVTGLFWPFCRIAGVLAIVPGLGGREVPVRVRVGLAVLLSVLIVPTLASGPTVDPVSAEGALLTFREIVTGLAMGLVVLVVFNAVMMAGESIAITMGLGFALMNDPRNGAQVPTVSQFYVICATLLFFALDGHHAVLTLLAESFRTLPVGQGLDSDALGRLLGWGATLFNGALAIALPALAAMLTVNLAMGVMTRAAPQLNLFSVGFPITMLVGFVAILLTLPSFGQSLDRLLGDGWLTLANLVSG